MKPASLRMAQPAAGLRKRRPLHDLRLPGIRHRQGLDLSPGDIGE